MDEQADGHTDGYTDGRTETQIDGWMWFMLRFYTTKVETLDPKEKPKCNLVLTLQRR